MTELLQHAEQSAEQPTISDTPKRQESPFVPPEMPVVTDIEMLAYLQRSGKLGEIAAQAEQDAWVIAACKQLEITVSDEEWQAAGDAFRLEHKLLGSKETLAWIAQQRTTIEAWSEGIKIALLTQKLKEHLFGSSVDAAYINDRSHYRRVALSQILVKDLPTAQSIVQKLREENASFCTLALTYSKGKQSQENGGFVGIRFLVELMPEIAQAIDTASEGEVVAPVQTKLGYHVLRVEKWFPTELSDAVRSQIMDASFQLWLEQARQTESASGTVEHE